MIGSRSIGMIAAAVAIMALAHSAQAVTLTYQFYGENGNSSGDNLALGSSHVYNNTASVGPTITATAGQYGGGSPAANNSTFTATGQLVDNNRGADEQGVGVCIGTDNSQYSCKQNGQDPLDADPEINYGNKETVRLDISSLFAAFGSFLINADSATSGELLGIFSSNSATNIGTKLTDTTSAAGDVGIIPSGNYLYFVSDHSDTNGDDVLLHSLKVSSLTVPEPTSLALFGSALIGFGLLRRRSNRA